MKTGTEVALGSITCPSGRLVIADTGYLSLWSGNETPVVDETVLAGLDDPALRESVLAAIDLAVVGPDADEAARTFDRQAGTWLYDIPAHGVQELTATFDGHCRTRRLNARLQRQQTRTAHRERAERCVRAGGQEFLIHGVPMVAIGGLPTDRRLDVTATRRDYGRIGARWESVRISAAPVNPASSRLLGHVGVDAGRISLIDADALAQWRHEEAIDGLADVAFWGLSADQASARFGAAPLTNPGRTASTGGRTCRSAKPPTVRSPCRTGRTRTRNGA